ncbi:hypothetical protein N9X99_01365 [Gammaproteobacteria bacterium]|nr:hypothetical protein [Gammaproteobacteria bacterium]
MTKQTIESLRYTLTSLQKRQSRLVFAKSAGLLLLALSTLAAAGIGYAAAFTSSGYASVGLLAVMLASGVGVTVLILRSSRRGLSDQKALAHYVEEQLPDFEQRLLTSLEFDRSQSTAAQRGVSPAFVEQLWRDAAAHLETQQREVQRVGSAREPLIFLFSGIAALTVIALALIESPALRSAAQGLMTPFAEIAVVEADPAAAIALEVMPGDVEMQRGDSLTVNVRVSNAQPPALTLQLQDDRLNWRDYPMTLEASDDGGASFSYYLPALMKDTLYRVLLPSGEVDSREHQITLYDLPRVESIAVALDFPAYTGEEDTVEEDSGDIVAPRGTQVALDVLFNKPLAQARILFESSLEGAEELYVDSDLQVDGLTGKVQFTVQGDGVYRIVANDLDGFETAAPLDYYIRAIEDQAPVLTLRRPGADQDVFPLEEVVLEVDASDDYGLSEFTLNYAVVGAEDTAIDFLPAETVRSAEGKTLLYLEDLAVEPGDFVSYYLTLADNNALDGPTQVVSDIYFLEVIPTEQEFRRANQQGGGGGGGQQGGGESSALVTVQKDIIAATWKLRNRLRSAEDQDIEADTEIIAQSQREATGRARMSIDRLAERLSFSDDSYDLAVENLSLAIEQMNLAADDLDELQVTSALKPEQLALQYILKAEANINRTDISMQQNSGGGGGGGAQQEREDLRELFEMEMGQLENRYETPGGNSQAGGSNAEEVNKLEELARRQEALTRAQRNLARREQDLEEEQRERELERLRRQQEQLSAELEQLARNSQSSQRGQQRSQSAAQDGVQSQQSSSQSSAQPSSPSGSRSSASAQASNGQSPTQDPAEDSPRSAIDRAIEQMQQASQSESAALAAARSQKALESLREQQRELTEQGESSVAQIARRLADRGQALLRQQQALEDGLQAVSEAQGLGQTRREARRDDALETLLDAQRQQQRDLEEIEDMLRAVVTRGDSDDRRLLTQAQAATRELQPLRDDMATSNRVLRNGMVNLAIDMEQDLGAQIDSLAQSLAGLNPSQQQTGDSQQLAQDAQRLREEIEALEAEVGQFNQQGQEPRGETSLAQMRERLSNSQQLAETVSQQLAQQRGGNAQRQPGQPSSVGTARSVRSQLSRQDVEDFLQRPELFEALLNPIIELEGALRAQAEREAASQQLFTADEEQVPEAYRDLVEQYYRTLSEGDSGGQP